MARPAECESTDDPVYPCDFKATDKQGSFKTTSSKGPTYIMEVTPSGVGSAWVNLGNRNIWLSGEFRLSKTDRGCWVSEDPKFKICAR